MIRSADLAATYPELTQSLETEDGDRLIQRCQARLAAQPNEMVLYAYLGLGYVLSGKDFEARATWGTIHKDLQTTPAKAQQWLEVLLVLLDTEAERQAHIQPAIAWRIRQHIRGFAPQSVENLAAIPLLCAPLQDAASIPLLLEQLVEAVQNVDMVQPAIPRLQAALKFYLGVSPAPPWSRIVDLLDVSVAKTQQTTKNQQFKSLVGVFLIHGVSLVTRLSEAERQQLSQRLWPLVDGYVDLLANAAKLFQDAKFFLESIPFAERILELPTPIKIEDEVAAYHSQLNALLKAGGQWQRIVELNQQYQAGLTRLLANPPAQITPFHQQMLPTTANLNYLDDAPEQTQRFRQQVATLTQASFADLGHEHLSVPPLQPLGDRKLRIGYLSQSLWQHSVGWISRWVFEHHDRQAVAVYAYATRLRKDAVQAQIQQQTTQFRDVSALESLDIAKLITQDQLDILVDLDSLTSTKICNVMSLKPAPIQVTWLGFDESCVPGIDYFIADRHVLPEVADTYYSAKIWRLPQTYVAVDGFESGVPSWQRRDFDIPDDAVVYLTAQTAAKRHPDCVAAQLQIIRRVPNSYLLIKGSGVRNEQSATPLQDFFNEMAIAQGVEPERLRFLPRTDTEATHRANLAQADVVLDTYPYNGATTTLETLWAGVPLVTQVGQQFAARNSYTMLKNVGVSAGIAWSREEYIDWGVRFGTEPKRRQAVVWQLYQARQQAPLWNARAFTRDLEAAYRQMVEHHLQCHPRLRA